MEHRLEHLLVAAGHQAQRAQYLQHRHLRLDVLRAEALQQGEGQTAVRGGCLHAPVYLGDGVDPGHVCEDVRPPRGVVHDRLDAAEGGRVDGGLRAVPVQPRQQVQQTGEALAGDR